MQHINSKKQRLKKVILTTVIILVTGIAYAIFFSKTGWGIPCIFRKITGLQCPGCGVTRMAISLLKGDLKKAWEYNSMLLCLILPLTATLGNIIVRYVRHGTLQPSKWAKVLMYIMIILLLGFGVCRNLPI